MVKLALSYWHILEYIREQELGGWGEYKTSTYFIAKRFNKKQWEIYKILERMRIYNRLVIKDKRRINRRKNPSKIYLLSKRAKKILEDRQLDSFLDSRNPYFEKSKENTKKRGNIFISYLAYPWYP